MPRYFIAISYKGEGYSGFQVQENANSVQAEVEKSFLVFFRRPVTLTGASRTDTGVHARENFFHFDWEEEISARSVYNLNAILPADIAIHRLYEVAADAHCRFDAIWREYHYYVYQKKNPFLQDRAFYYPFPLDRDRLAAAANQLVRQRDFTSFSKRNTQAKTATCEILLSRWSEREDCLVYEVRANRFLRGMVRGMVGTMLQVGTGRMTLEAFEQVILGRDASRADFSVPGKGLFLVRVAYPEGFLGELVG